MNICSKSTQVLCGICLFENCCLACWHHSTWNGLQDLRVYWLTNTLIYFITFACPWCLWPEKNKKRGRVEPKRLFINHALQFFGPHSFFSAENCFYHRAKDIFFLSFFFFFLLSRLSRKNKFISFLLSKGFSLFHHICHK